MSIPPNQFRRDHPWTRSVLLDSSAGAVPSQAKVTHSITLSLKKIQISTGRRTETSTDDILRCLTGRVDKLVDFWLHIHWEISLCQPALLSNAICRRLKSQFFYLCLFGFFFKDNVNEWVTFACDETAPADESKRTERVQGWSRLNWLGGILIIVSWHIQFNKLLMPLTPVCCLVN